ncbi:MAG: DUF3034 family protein [Rugosibacter sp.]|nr:MAG: DUF3034 family protein [Rugosibacter sp.]TBR07031.1 MAG: DUF3034 family protein [Rugosibacter sp.]
MILCAAKSRCWQDGELGKLLLTGGVSQGEDAAGGGLTPWTFIGGHGTDDEVGGNVFCHRGQDRRFSPQYLGVH